MGQDKFVWADKQRRAAQVLSLLELLVQKYTYWRRIRSSLLRLAAAKERRIKSILTLLALLVQTYEYCHLRSSGHLVLAIQRIFFESFFSF